MQAKYYHKSKPEDWQGRVDGERDVRLHQVVQFADLKTFQEAQGPTVAFLGFCSDEGVRRNQGRVGAAKGPQALRKALGNLAWHLPMTLNLLDVGNVYCPTRELEKAQQVLADGISVLLQQKVFPLILGGGHETAWGSYLGVRQALGATAKLGIINIDAHFDLRIPADTATSGTPFWQMAQWAKTNDANFDYFCLGINATANTKPLFERAKELGVDFLTIDDLLKLPMGSCPDRLTSFVKAQDGLYLTIDLDAFDAAFAPGVSAPASLGLSPLQVLPWIRHIANSGKLLLCDICELNPSYDLGQRTARLGASLLSRVMGAQLTL